MLDVPRNFVMSRTATEGGLARENEARLVQAYEPGFGDAGLYNDTLPPIGTLDEIAYQLTHGFWGGDSHRFNVTQGGTITVNLTGITADARTVAREALAVWTDIIGVNFVDVTSGGQIVFDDLNPFSFDRIHLSNVYANSLVAGDRRSRSSTTKRSPTPLASCGSSSRTATPTCSATPMETASPTS